MKKAIMVLVSVSFLAFLLPLTHINVQKSTLVADVKPTIEPIYPPAG
jgi:hypothetical protein